MVGAFNPVAPKLGQQDEGEGPFSPQNLEGDSAESYSIQHPLRDPGQPPNSDPGCTGQPRAMRSWTLIHPSGDPTWLHTSQHCTKDGGGVEESVAQRVPETLEPSETRKWVSNGTAFHEGFPGSW